MIPFYSFSFMNLLFAEYYLTPPRYLYNRDCTTLDRFHASFIVESEKAVEEEYFPEEARTATTSGPLHNGTPVFAQWRDKCFYPGFVKEMVSLLF